MEGGSTNADSDHSMTWEDFFGSTSDLTPTLIGIYDSLLEPSKKNTPEISRFDLNAKDTRNDPPLNKIEENSDITMVETNNVDVKEVAVPSKIPGGIKLPGLGNKTTLHNLRTKTDSEINRVADSDVSNSNLTTSEPSFLNRTLNRPIKTELRFTESNAYDNLSPNVKRMISSATETSSALKFQKKMTGARASVRGHRSHIPLVGATSKITQSGVEILPSVEIYDQPTGIMATKAKAEDKKPLTKESPTKQQKFTKPEFKIESQETYDVPTNNKPVFELNTDSKTTFEALSLPFIDQSLEINAAIQDREFDTKISPHKKSPEKVHPKIPVAIKEKSNSLTRNELSPTKSTKPEALGSIGNLKSLSSEKESSKPSTLNIEVTRPLSMSSIASSSSTSSSGVQNKGVNSAYLASIESLDDHSDADMISANGSNNFVNSAGLKDPVNLEGRGDNMWREHYEEMSGLSQLERVCAEIVYTENVYVRDLQQVVEGYLHVWKKDNIFSDEELDELFNNIEDIYNFNRSLCEELNSCRLDATSIARCFVNNTSGFSVYTSYCTGYPRTMARLAALASNPQSAREFRERQVDLGHPLPLASYLLKPVQRILKYHLLLQNVVKQCASNETEYALLKMTGIAQHIDDMKRKHEHAVRVQEIQSLLYGWNGPDLTTYGELCAEGTFRVFGAKAMRHVFLFDKMLLVTKNREDGILAYKSHIMCNNMMLVEAIAGAALSFHVIPWDAPRGQVTLQASSPRHKREWTLLLKRVILENYNVVIPSHARQIVMELGQNKTDDDMLAEKSHNLITQASIRKQLSAPEYLEKRKIDRERRKSLENGLRRRLKKPNRKQPIETSTNDQMPSPECDCIQVSNEKGIDFTCDVCYVDLCSDCETDPTSKDKNTKVSPKHDMSSDKCPECDRTLEYIDAGSAEQLERRSCKCTDFKSSQESFANLVKTRGYHSSDNISSYHDKTCDDASSRNQARTCLKCVKINENIVTEPLGSSFRKSRCLEPEKHKQQSNRSKSKEDTQRSKLSKIGTWRRKSEPGLPPNVNIVKKLNNYGGKRSETRGNEKIEFECRNCGTNKITRRDRSSEVDADLDSHRKRNVHQNNVDIKMYNTKTVPKKISKIKKIRAKGGRGPDTTAKFYAELSDVSDNILHISESNDSLNVDLIDATKSNEAISKDEDIDDETYKKLIEKTDSFKKNELEKVKYLNKEKVINEGSEVGDESVIVRHDEEALESGEETEQPLEQIISQLLLQNREFQKLLKKQQQRSSAHRRHQRLLKSHSNPEEPAPPPVPSNDKDQTSFRRQMSENLTHLPFELEIESNENKKETNIEEDHIYETLRPDSRVDESLHILNNKSKLIYHNNHKLIRPKRLPSPPKTIKTTEAQNDGLRNKESDYVYLSFDKLNNIGDEQEGIYEVPKKSPEKVVDRPKTQTDYYVMIDKQGPLILNSNKTATEVESYDNIVEYCKQKKEVIQTGSSDYLPMSPESPNTPEIWLNRQKEHFNVSRDRKSGSLPRSFQVPGNAEENGLSTFKSSNNKTYLNREGKVLSIDRPFTIASDQSEISYDDVENLMNESDILKFNKSNESDYSQNNSQSTLELEKEIDRCYKKNFESVNLNGSKDKDLLIVSQPNLNTSTASSCEVLSPDSNGNSKLPEIMHPQNKIYKPTSNLRSLRNVLTRFKTKTIKSNDDSDSQELSPKSDPKSPTNDKRSALNPRSYSKNLLQRFRSIIGDEQLDGNNMKPEKNDDTLSDARKIDIKVIITQSESSPTTSSITTQDALSKSVYEQTPFTKNNTEENQLAHLSNSCDNKSPKSIPKNRPPLEKSISVASSTTSSISVKSNSNSSQNLNKLPVYMQGSKHLGARIAQADYVDPTKLHNEKPDTKHVNVLINRISVRPDSLFSNSSFVTSSSEGLGQDGRKPDAPETKSLKNIENNDNTKAKLQSHADESYYEKTFEKYITDDDVFRDSAVYSDQDDLEDNNKMATIKKISKTVTKQTESNKKEIKKVIITKVSESKTVTNTNISPTVSSQPNDKMKHELINKNKTRIAPPVPVKPKITNIPTTTALNAKIINNKLVSQISVNKQTESTNTVKRNANLKQSFLRSESAPDDRNKTKSADTSSTINKDQTDKKPNAVDDIINKGNINNISAINNIHIKRLSFERASLDSATRKIKTLEVKNTNDTMNTTAKTVQERRMEIESLTKTQAKVSQLKKPTQIARPKAAPSKSLNDQKQSLPLDKNNIPTNDNNITMSNIEVSETDNEAKGSWVKTVVNKFQ